LLRSRGIDDARIRVIHAHCGEGEPFALEVRAFADELTAAGRTH